MTDYNNLKKAFEYGKEYYVNVIEKVYPIFDFDNWYNNLKEMGKLKERDLEDLQYFWKYENDLERLTTFEEMKPLLYKEKPEVMKAWNDYIASKKILDLVMEDICNTSE